MSKYLFVELRGWQPSKTLQHIAILGFCFLTGYTSQSWSQQKGIARATHRIKRPGANKPECAKNAICFSGEVRNGAEYRKRLNDNLEFVFRLPGGIDVVSAHPEDGCKLSLWIANPPLMAHHSTEIDALYEWTAEQEVKDSPRYFRFPQTCQEFEGLYDLIYTPGKSDVMTYSACLETLAKGHGRLWIESSDVKHSYNSKSSNHGTIEWIKFSVELSLAK